MLRKEKELHAIFLEKHPAAELRRMAAEDRMITMVAAAEEQMVQQEVLEVTEFQQVHLPVNARLLEKEEKQILIQIL